MQEWHLLSRSPYQDYFSNGSNSQTKQDLAVQHHQLRKQVLSSTSLLSPPSSSVAVKHEPRLPTPGEKKMIQAFEPKCLRKLLRLSYLEHKTNDWVRKQDQLPCGPTGTSSVVRQETETCMVRACHTPREPVQNRPSGHIGQWETP